MHSDDTERVDHSDCSPRTPGPEESDHSGRAEMNIVVWADKGGVGKTTLATSLAAELVAALVDVDPQGDAARWGAVRGFPVTVTQDRKALEALFKKPGLRVVDCPPGQGQEAITAVGWADLLVIPARTGEADMVALGRSLDVAQRVREVRPNVQIGLVLNLVRETGRAKGVETALRAQAGRDYQWLGRLCARVGAEEAYASGRTLLQAGGAVAFEFRQVLNAVSRIVSDYYDGSDLSDHSEQSAH